MLALHKEDAQPIDSFEQWHQITAANIRFRSANGTPTATSASGSSAEHSDRSQSAMPYRCRAGRYVSTVDRRKLGKIRGTILCWFWSCAVRSM